MHLRKYTQWLRQGKLQNFREGNAFQYQIRMARK